jgi:hypothetical protein
MTASVLDPGQGNKQPESNTVTLKQIPFSDDCIKDKNLRA